MGTGMSAENDREMMKARMTKKMIDFYQGNREDIVHFLKVHAYAELIGRLEGLDEDTLLTLELAAIVHDIACPICREKYGNTNGDHQEAESETLLRPFLEEFGLEREREERIVFLVTHHHTYANVEGVDYQILLEADYLVNADENPKKYLKGYRTFRDKVYRTSAGKQLLEEMFLDAENYA